MKMKFASVALAALVVATAPAQAALTVYTTLAAFNAATSAQGTDGFNGLSIVSSTPSPITRTTSVGTAYTYTATASTDVFFGAGTTANPWLSTNLATDSILFNGFTGTPNAIGGNFFGSDIAGAFLAGDVVLTVVDSLGATSAQTITGAQVASFRGFVSTGNITSLTISAVQTASPLWPTVDNLTLAKRPAVGAVPEPSTWLLMLGGFGLVGGAMRRRSSGSVALAA